ncbi:hypothetical protein FOZ61_008121 [Perkinsus olseni]|uniref:Golgin-84 n=1 Tax=Perkinsus olseni TaxID=32597 RepID=A0A7J6M8R9_PEROL|nr:hypothetical protein FOZ61_008121 [Perkinsus olseni]KAF4674770.1 hypothetical protein FOL46_004030 [Perkinsus olseni]
MDLFRKINDILDAADAEDAERKSAATSEDLRNAHGGRSTVDTSQNGEALGTPSRVGGEARPGSGSRWAAGGSSWVKGLSDRASAALQNISPPSRAPSAAATGAEHVSLGAYPRPAQPEPSAVVPDDLFGSAGDGHDNDDLLVWESEAATSTWRPKEQQQAEVATLPAAPTPSDVFGNAAADAARVISEEEEGSDVASGEAKEMPVSPRSPEDAIMAREIVPVPAAIAHPLAPGKAQNAGGQQLDDADVESGAEVVEDTQGPDLGTAEGAERESEADGATALGADTARLPEDEQPDRSPEEESPRSPPPPPAIPDTTDESPSLSTTPRQSEASMRERREIDGSSSPAESSPQRDDTDHSPEGCGTVVVEGSGSSGESGSSRVVVEPNTRMLVEKAERLENLLLESSSRVNDLEKALQLKEGEMRDLQHTYAEEISKAVGRGDGSLQSLRREMQKLRQRCADLQEEVQNQMKGSERDVEAARQEMEGELALLLGQKESSIADLKSQLAAERSRSAQLEGDLATTRSKLKDKDATSTSELAKLRRQLSDYSESNAELKNAYANANAEVERTSAAVADGNKRTEELEKSLAAAELRAENASSESAKLAQQVFELQSSLHEKDLAATTAGAVEAAKTRVSQLEDALKEKADKIEQAEEELRRTTARADSDKERFMARISALESDLAAAKTALGRQSSPPTTDLQETITRLQKGMTQAAQGHMREVEVLQKRISEKDRRIEALVCEVNVYRNDQQQQQQESSSYKFGGGRQLSDVELGEMSPFGTPRVGRNKRIRDGMVELRPNRGNPIIKIVNEIDTVSRAAVRQLVRSPFARVLLLLYVVALHVWVLLILQWSLRETRTPATGDQ